MGSMLVTLDSLSYLFKQYTLMSILYITTQMLHKKVNDLYNDFSCLNCIFQSQRNSFALRMSIFLLL